MQATLHPDGSLELVGKTESRLIRPQHKSHQALMILYQHHAGIALSAHQRAKEASARTGNDAEREHVPPPGYGGNPWIKGTPRPAEVYNVPIEHIHADPDRLQYRGGIDLDGEDFDARQAGNLSVWKDPANGLTYIVDGHGRLELARRTGVPEVRAKYVKAKDASEARNIGAKLNGHDPVQDAKDAEDAYQEELRAANAEMKSSRETRVESQEPEWDDTSVPAWPEANTTPMPWDDAYSPAPTPAPAMSPLPDVTIPDVSAPAAPDAGELMWGSRAAPAPEASVAAEQRQIIALIRQGDRYAATDLFKKYIADHQLAPHEARYVAQTLRRRAAEPDDADETPPLFTDERHDATSLSAAHPLFSENVRAEALRALRARFPLSTWAAEDEALELSAKAAKDALFEPGKALVPWKGASTAPIAAPIPASIVAAAPAAAPPPAAPQPPIDLTINLAMPPIMNNITLNPQAPPVLNVNMAAAEPVPITIENKIEVQPADVIVQQQTIEKKITISKDRDGKWTGEVKPVPPAEPPDDPTE